jgi:uncharacterized protein involved in exopolysaccharide biosynthesis
MPEATPPPPPPHHPGPATGMGETDDHIVERRSLRDYYIILRERLWIALPLALLVAVSIGYYQSRETPMYSATASMQFITKAQKIVVNQTVQDTTVQSDVDFNNYISLLRSSEIRAKVVASFDKNDEKILLRPFLKDLPPGQAPPRAQDVVSGWDVTPRKASTYIDITVRHQDGEAAALIANRVVDQFKNYLERNKTGMDEQALKALMNNVKDAQSKAEEAQKKLNDFIRANNLGSSLESARNLADAGIGRDTALDLLWAVNQSWDEPKDLDGVKEAVNKATRTLQKADCSMTSCALFWCKSLTASEALPSNW